MCQDCLILLTSISIVKIDPSTLQLESRSHDTSHFFSVSFFVFKQKGVLAKHRWVYSTPHTLLNALVMSNSYNILEMYDEITENLRISSSSGTIDLHAGYGAETLHGLMPARLLIRPWREDLCGRVLCDGAHLFQAAQFAQTHQLQQHVAVGCRFGWPGDHRHVQRVGQPLVEPRVARSATQHMHGRDRRPGQCADLMKDLAIAQYEALHDAPREGRWSRKLRLPMFC